MKTVRGGGKSNEEVEADDRGRKEKIQKLLREMEAKLNESKFSVADYIRLLQFERELEAEEPPREIRVTWVDRVETPDSGK